MDLATSSIIYTVEWQIKRHCTQVWDTSRARTSSFWLYNVIGAIDCMHIKNLKVGGNSAEYFINVQTVCDSELKKRYIEAHWRDSTHDTRIFREKLQKY